MEQLRADFAREQELRMGAEARERQQRERAMAAEAREEAERQRAEAAEALEADLRHKLRQAQEAAQGGASSNDSCESRCRLTVHTGLTGVALSLPACALQGVPMLAVPVVEPSSACRLRSRQAASTSESHFPAPFPAAPFPGEDPMSLGTVK